MVGVIDDFVVDSGLRAGVGESATCLRFHAVVGLECVADVGYLLYMRRSQGSRPISKVL